MSNVAQLQSLPSNLPHSYLGPAEVLAESPASLTLSLRDGTEVEAALALGFSYQPTVGDRVLSIGNEDGFYVIGVLTTQGTARMSFPGDVELSAGGTLRLRALQGIEIDGAEVTIRAGKLEMMARRVSQRFDSMRQRVVGLLSVQAGKTHTVVEGADYKRAESSTLLTKEKVSINGKAIHLG